MAEGERSSGFRWLVSEILKTERFKNAITMVLVLTYCWMTIKDVKPSNEFALLVGMVLGFYFKKG